MSSVDVLLVSLGSTGGLRAADEQLAELLRDAGATVEVAKAEPQRQVRTMALTDLLWARACANAARAALSRSSPRAIIYSSATAALFWPERGAIRFDASAAENRAGHHGIWQRPLERRRFNEASLLIPWSEAALVEAAGHPVTVVPGSPINLKITSREDLRLAEQALKVLPKPKLSGPAHPFAGDDIWR